MGRILTLFVGLGLVVGGVAYWRATRSGSEGAVAPPGEVSALGAAQKELLEAAGPETNEPARAEALASEREPLETPARARATVNAARAGAVPPLEGELFGRVVRADGAPVEGALVLLESEGRFRSELAPLARTKTDAQGRFAFAKVGTGPFRLEASERPRKGAQGHVVLEPALPGEHVLVLQSCLVTGLVIDESNKVVPRFRVEARALDLELPESPRGGPRAQGRDGNFEIALAPGRWSLHVTQPRGATSVTREIEVPLVEPLLFELPTVSVIEGLVVDGSGTPVARAKVEAGTGGRRQLPEQRTKADGRFRLELAATDALEVWAEGSHGEKSPCVAVPLHPGETRSGIVLTLPTLARVTGRLVSAAGDSTGREVSGSFDGVNYGALTARTNEGGYFALDVPPGDLTITIGLSERDGAFLDERGWQSSSPRLSRRVTLGPGEAQHLEFVVDSPVRIHGTVTCGGQPVDEGSVRAYFIGSGGSHELAEIRGGRYELSAFGSGAGELSFQGDGWEHTRLRIDVPPVAEFRYDVSIETGTLVGVVRDAAGTPVEELTVDAMDSEGERMGSGRARTDERGAYRMALAVGTFRVFPRTDFEEQRSFREPDAQFVEILPGKEARADFELLSAATVDGVVRRADGGALDGGVVFLDDGKNRAEASFGPDGRFHATFEGSAASLSAFGRSGEAYFIPSEALELTLAPSRVTTLDIPLVRACHVQVRLSGVDDDDFSRVEAIDDRGHALAFRRDRSIPTSSHGALLFPGSYRLRAHPDSLHARSEEPCSAMVERELVVGPLDRALEVQVGFD